MNGEFGGNPGSRSGQILTEGQNFATSSEGQDYVEVIKPTAEGMRVETPSVTPDEKMAMQAAVLELIQGKRISSLSHEAEELVLRTAFGMEDIDFDDPPVEEKVRIGLLEDVASELIANELAANNRGGNG